MAGLNAIERAALEALIEHGALVGFHSRGYLIYKPGWKDKALTWQPREEADRGFMRSTVEDLVRKGFAVPHEKQENVVVIP
jgi:hypothetical protein